jgi:hypothetical protein
MYAVMRMLGVNIHPASMQSNDGKKMWSRWNKQGHAQHIKSMNAKMAENFADGKNPGRKGLAKRSGVNTKASVSSLRKTAKHSSGEKARMAHWLANMKAGRERAAKEDAAGVGTITAQNTTVDVDQHTPQKNLKAFRL